MSHLLYGLAPDDPATFVAAECRGGGACRCCPRRESIPPPCCASREPVGALRDHRSEAGACQLGRRSEAVGSVLLFGP